MRVNLSDNKAYKIQKIRILYFNSDNGVVKNFQFCPIASESYTAKSKKVALVIGHSGIWNNAMIYLSENQTISSQCPIPNAQSNLFWISYLSNLGYCSLL